MGPNEEFTNIRALLGALAKAMNLVNHEVEHHHEQTAYLTYAMCRDLGFSEELLMSATYAALLHDVGSVVMHHGTSLKEVERDSFNIAKTGEKMLADLPGFEEIARIVGLCQHPWPILRAKQAAGAIDQRTAKIAGIIHLADSASIVLDPEKPVLSQAKRVRKLVRDCSNFIFCPEGAEAFLRVTEPEFVWLDVMFNPEFLLYFTGEIGSVSLQETLNLTRLVSRIIDYRSPFTAMHSAGVAASARRLAELSGMTEDECTMMEIAGNLHDVGKLRVPREILEKPGKLTDEEFDVIKEHSYYTRLVLMEIPGFELIADWAGLHHEKLNGNGYPFHFAADRLDQGSRIMAVADIFSAVAEDRPYRAPMTREQTIEVLHQNVASGGICGKVVNTLVDNYADVDSVRDQASRTAGSRYYESLESANEPDGASGPGDASGDGGASKASGIPGLPGIPGMPDIPTLPELPNLPSMPDISDIPGIADAADWLFDLKIAQPFLHPVLARCRESVSRDAEKE